MDKEDLLEELARLLDRGELLLAAFPKAHPDGWTLRLPAGVSNDMRWYAHDVSWRELDREQWWDYRLWNSTSYLRDLVEKCETGLLGWRAVGLIR